jgi:hypothetical protein
VGRVAEVVDLGAAGVLVDVDDDDFGDDAPEDEGLGDGAADGAGLFQWAGIGRGEKGGSGRTRRR